MNARTQRGFTLIEMLIALVLLAAMMSLLYSGVNFGLRSWDAADVNGRRTADRRIGENFLRRELTQLFPMRFKDPMTLKFAFSGEREQLRFVSSRPAGVTQGGLSLVGIDVEEGDGRTRNLVMRRAMPDDAAKDFGPLDAAKPTVLLEGIDAVAFSYFGSENDFTDPQWYDTWTFDGHIPALVRISMRAADGSLLPAMTVHVELSEEAGCLENTYQRVCRPRREGA
ncbi:MAG TPA: prepilin-type N-terminal cleavage/methylation domain-containing protein [Usitatibacter sp.]|nr:prepilin-type N-terminal cleavage/methylation domain-containing protein [Usitatibacter sp.]